jgi:PAS domain S-box-containing protein
MPSREQSVALGNPPVDWDVRWVRGAAAVLMAVVFWVDTLTPIGFAEPVLYVAPVLLFMAAGAFWEPLAVAGLVTLLMIAGFVFTPPGGDAQLGAYNRPLEGAAVWLAAILVAVYRRNLERWTSRFASEREARDRSIHRLEEIRQALDQAAIVATTDQKGVITYVNDKFCEISGYARHELLGQDHRIVNSAYHPKEFIRDLWRTIAQGRIWRGELRNRAKDGHIYWVDTTIVPFVDAAGRPRQYLAIRSDITQRKAAEAKLVEQSSLAQLGQLAAVVAHEVRNPLAGVRGSLQILRSRQDPASQDVAIMDAMIARIDVLNAKVEDILRFARPRTPVLESVDARVVILDAVNSARAATGPECPEIATPGQTAWVTADREMLRDVLLNLVLNACQSGTTAPVEVSVTSISDRCRIDISDRGTGIPAGHGERIFQAFFTTKKAGTGLGLAIVQRLVLLQEGQVTLLPREGGGTVASVDLPLAAVAVPAQPQAQAAASAIGR